MKNKINVNISPNPLDLQTLHCSQNDTGERKFYFTLHNNGEVIDTTDISDPIFEPFDVYKGGTEQLLPVNTGVPTTSPIIADIQYPDEEKTEQEFTYRESPTTIDGKALVEKIKGNTIEWNQLAESFDVGNYGTNHAYGGTYSQADGVATVVGSNGTDFHNNTVQILANHKYLISADVKVSINEQALRFRIASVQSDNISVSANTWTQIAKIMTSSVDGLRAFILTSHTLTLNVKDFCIFDLTTMFGAGKEPSTVEEFTSLFPLPYYQYDAGSLLSFNGTGIKTVGINKLPNNAVNETTTSQGKTLEKNNGVYHLYGTATAGTSFNIPLAESVDLQPGTNKIMFFNTTVGAGISVYFKRGNSNIHFWGMDPANRVATSWTDTGNEVIDTLQISVPSGNTTDMYISPMLVSLDKTIESFEPYHTSTTSIPTDTYFPTGMKSAGTVYDELTNSKAITRIGEVDLGTLDWSYYPSTKRFFAAIADAALARTSVLANAVCEKYNLVIWSSITNDTSVDNAYAMAGSNNVPYITIRDTSYTSTSDFKTAMNGVMLQYELAEEQVVNFTHASLICEDGESALYHDDDSLACECTEDFSKDSGFKDCKIKFTNDDEVVYSSKIQLHIERKP